MKYEHKQTSPLNFILYGIGIVQLVAAWISRSNPAASIILLGAGVVLILAGLCVGYLVVRDEGDFLALRYGPLPVFQRRIPFSHIRSVEPGRSNVIDGWGIHYIPGRGMTYNLWGFDCVKLKVDRHIVRVGTDDVQGLVQFFEREGNGLRERWERIRTTSSWTSTETTKSYKETDREEGNYPRRTV